jgi:hypothetical protein
VRAASTTKGMASRISQAGNFGTVEASSFPGPEELLLPDAIVVWFPLLIFLNIILRSPSTI